MHFLQESYKFVQESQILKVCHNVEHFLQESDYIFYYLLILNNSSDSTIIKVGSKCIAP